MSSGQVGVAFQFELWSDFKEPAEVIHGKHFHEVTTKKRSEVIFYDCLDLQLQFGCEITDRHFRPPRDVVRRHIENVVGLMPKKAPRIGHTENEASARFQAAHAGIQKGSQINDVFKDLEEANHVVLRHGGAGVVLNQLCAYINLASFTRRSGRQIKFQADIANIRADVGWKRMPEEALPAANLEHRHTILDVRRCKFKLLATSGIELMQKHGRDLP